MSRPSLVQPQSLKLRKEKEGEWLELQAISDVAIARGLKALGEEQLQRLPALHRSALSSLSLARRTALDRALVEYLEALAARSYIAVYGSRRPVRGAIRSFFTTLFPRAVRAIGAELGLSTLIFSLGVAVAIALTMADPSWYFAFIDPAMAAGRTPVASTAELEATLYDDASGQGLTMFASFLFTHNARIAILAFALGFAAGVPTALLLFLNGLTLGAFVGLFAERGLLIPLLGWLLPHGIPEIGAVLLCGAAGFSLGRAIIFPGALRARDALIQAGRRATIVVLGAVALLAVAGAVEGVFRQVVQDDLVRFALAAFNATWLSLWILLGGRGAARRGS